MTVDESCWIRGFCYNMKYKVKFQIYLTTLGYFLSLCYVYLYKLLVSVLHQKDQLISIVAETMSNCFT